jgi:hypothetical protein
MLSGRGLCDGPIPRPEKSTTRHRAEWSCRANLYSNPINKQSVVIRCAVSCDEGSAVQRDG